MRKLALVALMAASLNCTAQAHTMDVPDPATVVIPDLSGSADPAVVSNGWKYFFFQRKGVSFEEAYADFVDCHRFLQPNDGTTVALRRFVPWSRASTNSATVKKTEKLLAPYGMVGAMIEDTLARRDYQATMRLCMEPRGYTRHGVSQEIYERASKLPLDQWLAVQSKIASGPDFGGKVPVK